MKLQNRTTDLLYQKAVKAGIGLTAAAMLSACGGGGGGSTASTAQDPVSAGSISGTASKGIVSAGLVSAYTIVNGAQSAAAIGNATTDANGDYTITFPNTYNGEPLVIKVAADQDTRMACDIATGCGLDASGNAIAFGGSYKLDNTFSLSAIVNGAQASAVIANLTPLTSASTEIALASLAGLTTTSTFNVSEAIANANSQVAIRFGFTGDVTQLPVVDLTNPADVAAAIAGDASTVEYAAINAAIVSAIQADAVTAGSPVDIEMAISNFTANFAAAGISDNSIDPQLTDLGDILAESQAVLNEVASDLTDAGLTDALTELANLESDLAAEESMANLETPSDTGDQGTPSETAGAAALAKAKALVEQVRDLGAFIEMTAVGENDPTDTVRSALDNFQLQVDAAELASSASVDQAAEALGLAAEAVIEVYDLNFDFETGLPLEGSEIATSGSSSFNGITVDYSDVEGSAVFTVNQDVTLADLVSIAAVSTTFSLPAISATEVCDGVQDIEVGGILFTNVDNCTFDSNATLTASGSATAGDVTVTITQGEITAALAVVENASVEQVDPETVVETGTESLNLNGLAFDLDVTIQQADTEQSGGPMYFDGQLSFSLSTASVDVDYSTTVLLEPASPVDASTLVNTTLYNVFFDFADCGSGAVLEPIAVTQAAYTLELCNGVVEQGSWAVLASGVLSLEYPDGQGVSTDYLAVRYYDHRINGWQICYADSEQGALDPGCSNGGADWLFTDQQAAIAFQSELNGGPFIEGGDNWIDAYEDVYNFGIVSFSLAGTFGNDETEFTAAFSIDGDVTGVTFTEMFDEAMDPYNSDSILNETEADFINGSMSLMFTADLAGLTLPGDDGTVEFEVTRTGLDDITSSAEITFPGNMLMFEATATSLNTDSSMVAAATVTNQDGVVINLDFDDSAVNEDDEMSGTIEVEGEVYADIAMENGLTMVFYVDGTFETIY